MTRRNQTIWWSAVLVATTLPFTFNELLVNFGGNITDWMYYGNYRDLISLVLLLSAGLVGWLMYKPSAYPGARFAFSAIVIVIYLLGAIMPRPTCEEKIFLGKWEGSATTQQTSSIGGCH